MTLPLWLEIAIGLLVGVIFLAVLSLLISFLVWALAGDHIQRSAYMGARSLKPQLKELLNPATL